MQFVQFWRFLIGLCVSFMLVFTGGGVWAALSVTGATINGGSSATVAPGATLAVTVTNTGTTSWGSTAWFIGTSPPGTWNCDTAPSPSVTGTNTVNLTGSITAPSAPGTYNAYFRASSGTTCGSTLSSTYTLPNSVTVYSVPSPPTVTTSAATVTASGVTLNGTVNPNGSPVTSITFEYGLTTAYGAAIVATPNTLPGNSTVASISASLTGLACGATYNYRINATNSNGTVSGTNKTFTVSTKVIEFNTTGGTTTTDGLHMYVDCTTKIQSVRNGKGQVYEPTSFPPNSRMDNGVFIRANGSLYGSSHNVGSGFTPSGGLYDSMSLTDTAPPNPSTVFVEQTATSNVSMTSGPQVTIVWRYTTPNQYFTVDATLTIPTGYPVSASNPVRYYHAVDTYLEGADQGCGIAYLDANGKRVVGSYPDSTLSIGNTCQSTTTLPSTAGLIEAFREVSGLPFSHYCTNLWSNFWDTATSGTACAIEGIANLTDTVTNKYQDTGVAIEYDFTAPGTYQFSYDTFSGSLIVPAYDHIEIQHDGSGKLCADNLTVLACTSSTVPCPALNRVNSGVLTGNVTVTGTPTVGLSPAAGAFSVGTASSTALVALTGVAPGGTYTLSATNLSKTALNGVKCYNTATNTQSCSFAVQNQSCYADRMDACSNLTGTPARCSANASQNRLYTKVAGQSLDFDLVALNAGTPTTLNSAFANTVKVDLIANPVGGSISATTQCPTSPISISGVTPQSIAFTAGRPASTTTFTVPAASNTVAYQDVRVRFDQGGGVVSCSSDNFAIRPSAVTLNTSAIAAAPSATATPVIKAGANFTLSATTSAGTNYAPTLTQDVTQLTAQDPTQIVQASGGNLGILAPASLTVNAAAINATYSEVGHVYLATGAYYDAANPAFTAVDASSGDCIVGSFSDTLVGGKYGCNIGNVATVSLGRFIPDHFDTAIVNTSTAPIPCPAGLVCTTNTSGANGLIYATQPFSVQVTAKNAAGVTTQNYRSNFAKATTLSAWNAAGGATPNPGGGSLSNTALAATAFANGVGSTVLPSYALGSVTAAPTDVFIRATENAGGDGVTSNRASGAVEAGIKIANGRIKIPNAYGSEKLMLPITTTVQYYTGNYWTTSLTDSVSSFNTALSPTGNLIVGSVVGLGGSLSVVNPASAAVANGVRMFNIAIPNAVGHANLFLNAPSYLPSTTGLVNFGLYKSTLIDRRENY